MIQAINDRRPRRRTCNACGDWLPIEAFRLRSKGGTARHSECNDCAVEKRRELRARSQRRNIKKFVATILRRRSNGDVVATLAAAMIRRFHGLDGFVTAWEESILSANIGSAEALKSFEAIVKMIELCSPPQPTQNDTELLSDEDIEREMLDIGRRIVGT